ncbi:PAB-dependent poly(A)-specific ribonuclease subunit 3, partial [Teratosphaeriaceae sp. CCFEE 6253]
MDPRDFGNGRHGSLTDPSSARRAVRNNQPADSAGLRRGYPLNAGPNDIHGSPREHTRTAKATITVNVHGQPIQIPVDPRIFLPSRPTSFDPIKLPDGLILTPNSQNHPARSPAHRHSYQSLQGQPRGAPRVARPPASVYRGPSTSVQPPIGAPTTGHGFISLPYHLAPSLYIHHWTERRNYSAGGSHHSPVNFHNRETSAETTPEPVRPGHIVHQHFSGRVVSSSSSNDMAAGVSMQSQDARRHISASNQRTGRAENQRPMSGQLCRNGPQCRKYQEGTCHYSHDFGSMQGTGLTVPKKSLNVESPSFTPNFTPNPAKALPVKSLGLSPKAAGAAAFTPRGSGTVTPAGITHSKHASEEFVPQHVFQPQQQFNEFVPGQNFIPQQQIDSPPQMQPQINPYGDPFMSPQSLHQVMPRLDGSQAQMNPYSQAPAVSGHRFYQDTSGYKHPLNYHLYAS